MTRGSAGAVAKLVLLVIRGVLLWLVIPLGLVLWLVTFQWIGKRAVTLGAFLGWLDNNLVYLLQRGLLRPWFPVATVTWIRARDRSRTIHRVRGMDLA